MYFNVIYIFPQHHQSPIVRKIAKQAFLDVNIAAHPPVEIIKNALIEDIGLMGRLEDTPIIPLNVDS